MVIKTHTQRAFQPYLPTLVKNLPDMQHQENRKWVAAATAITGE
jgi:hypothetical protein